jgi:hypothetical protein
MEIYRISTSNNNENRIENTLHKPLDPYEILEWDDLDVVPDVRDAIELKPLIFLPMKLKYRTAPLEQNVTATVHMCSTFISNV